MYFYKDYNITYKQGIFFIWTSTKITLKIHFRILGCQGRESFSTNLQIDKKGRFLKDIEWAKEKFMIESVA
jgi:hypothetical protein